MSKLLFTIILLLPIAVSAIELQIGDDCPVLHFSDQYEQPHSINEEVRLVIFSPDRSAAKLAHQLLSGRDQVFLEQRGIRSVGDISGMPGLITRFVALPKFRGYSYPQLLGRRAEETILFPRKPGEITLLHLNRLKVVRIEYSDAVETVESAIQALTVRVSGQ